MLAIGCLGLLLLTCAALSALAVALTSGPVDIGLPGNSALKFGSDNIVLSNSSFQNGTTYYADFKAAGIRDILEIHDLVDSHSFEIVLHQATTGEQKEQRLLTLPSP